ncbi:CoA activase [bacterium]|nr:CoA activase [bacterium]
MIKHFIGLDIGSTYTKTAVINENKELLQLVFKPTGWNGAETAEQVRQELADKGIDLAEAKIIATGYGRVSVPFAQKCVTEITCHGKGAAFVYGKPNLTIIDIGGQDTKIIQVLDGAVNDFVMNDKCSAGTGRFLEVMAKTLSVDIAQLCDLASQGGNTSISSMCTVFAESEVISLIGRGEKRENIAFAVVDSIVKKVASQAKRMITPGSFLCLTGGLSESQYLLNALSKELRTPIASHPHGRYAGAIGAALLALNL